MKKTKLTLQIPPSEIAEYQWWNFLGNILVIPMIAFLSYSIFSQENDFYSKLGYLAFAIVLSYHFIGAKQESKAVTLEQLVLNEEGIRYCSGYSTQDKDWRVTWDRIKLVEIKLYHVKAVDIVLCVQTTEKSYETSIFKWVDTQTLKAEHIALKGLAAQNLKFRLTSSHYTQTEFDEILHYAPLYQYFVTNKIPVQLPDSKIFTELSPVVKWGAVLIVIFILLLISPFFIISI